MNTTFIIDNFNIIYPRFILNKNKDKYYDFKTSVLKSNYSRTYQLNNRSIQSIIFDKLIEIDYFNLLGINETILKEFVLINTDLDNDKTRSYYLLDYFIPSKSLCIELDSNFHYEDKDKIKDKFLNSLGIKVLRIRDFNIDTKNKLNSIINFIQSNPYNEFKVDYSELIEEYEEYKRNIEKNNMSRITEILNDSDKIDKMYNYFMSIGITPKKAENLSKISMIDNNIFLSILNNRSYISTICLDDIYYIIPMSQKKSKEYNCIKSFLKKYNIELNIIRNKR